MPSGNPFKTANFNPANVAPNEAVIFDDSGYLSTGGISNPNGLGYNQPYMDAYIESSFAAQGLGGVVFDIDAQFADATYFIGINSAVSTSSGTTYYVDHGFQGTSGSDVILDISGANIANTGDGDDLVILGHAQNFVDTGRGNDVLVTGAGDDVVKLKGGHDWAWLGAGDDKVRAGGGRDTVFGGDGDDLVKMGGGADWVDAGAGNDSVSGGRGADTFVFTAGNEIDVILDFETGRDVLQIDTATGVSSFNDVLGGATQQGLDAVLDLGGSDMLILQDTNIATLSASDFVFV